MGEEELEIPPFDLLAFMAETDRLFGVSVYNWISFIFIFFCLAYIYNKVFRVRKLPPFKALIIYAIIALGAFLLLVFQVDANLPIVYSLLIAISLMLIVKARYWFEEKSGKTMK